MIITEKAFKEHLETVTKLRNLLNEIENLGKKLSDILKKHNKVLLMGNGGSAADCQHIAAELVGRFKKERKGLPAIALTTDTSILTAVGNDYSFNEIFARQIEALANKGDLVIGISTSGNSENVIRGILKAKEIGCYTVGLLGKNGGKLKDLVDLAIVVPSNNTPRIQECHILIGHIVCEIVDREFSDV
ncbi:D-sedoheptulose 7-phosphate isomerase [Desulfurobacterium atlanticum]|uniref:Phosphoheptose isomerase n=1 Tax=Desulfurobacterium atlanticum TaxID=240169 RepID=A0A238XQ04_9BACT|nr:D-sedoheptulose 7-phosphate isomerase [Desulfurobacterium atlanticum]SNR60790.1 phosphoheptose isomerase [Desulfurobacterium atlanticum]